MAFIEDMQAHHLTLLQKLDGREIIYTPLVGLPRVLSGMFQSFSELSGGETVNVVATNPVLSIRTCDIPEITIGDQFCIDGHDYEVAIIQPDNEGITELMLEKL